MKEINSPKLTFRDAVMRNININWLHGSYISKDYLQANIGQTFGALTDVQQKHYDKNHSELNMEFGDINLTFHITWKDKDERGCYYHIQSID